MPIYDEENVGADRRWAFSISARDTRRYLRPGSIQDLPNGQIRITPLESETQLALVHIGVRLGL